LVLQISAMVEANATDDDSEYLQLIKLHYQSCLLSNDQQQVQPGNCFTLDIVMQYTTIFDKSYFNSWVSMFVDKQCWTGS
jgi:hypothetical protein